MVEQHYYTRAKSGIFRKSEGFDTVAKSAGLRNDIIKKSIHPFCKYDSPLELQKSGEKDEDKYPKSLLFTYTQTGDLIIGQYKYLDKDLGSNSRNAFFVHHYFISSDYSEYIDNIITDVRKMLYINDFKETISQDQSKEIPSLELNQISVDYSVEDVHDREKELFDLGINSDIFKKLLFAVIMSISTKKKVYIALDISASEIANAARRVLDCILSCLPYDSRRKIGFLTYARQPEGKKGINVMFVEKGSINLSDRTIIRDYIFDFANKRFENVEGASGYYLDFAFNNVENKTKMKGFFEFVESFRSVLNDDDRVSIENYNTLSMLYDYKCGNSRVYYENKGNMIEAIIEYIKKSKVSNVTSDLNTVAFEILNQEYAEISAGKGNYIPPISIIKSCAEYFSLVNNDQIKKTVNMLMLFSIRNGSNSSNSEYVFTIFKSCESNKELFNRLVETLFQYSDLVKSIFYKYLDDRFAVTKNLNDTLKEIKFWIGTYENILRDKHFIEKSTQNILKCIQNSRNKMYDNKIIIKSLRSGIVVSDKNMEILNSCIDDILLQCDNIVLESIDLENISKQEIFSLEFSRKYPNYSKYKIIEFAKYILQMDSTNYNMIKRYAMDLGNSEVRLKGLLKRCLNDQINKSSFHRIIYVFENNGNVDFNVVIDYINSAGKEAVYDFIDWAFDEKLFLRGGSDKPEPEFKNAVMKYFLDNDKEAIRDKELRNRFRKYTNLDKIMKELEYEASSGVHKLIVKYKEVIIICVICILTIAAGILIGIAVYNVLPQNINSATTQSKNIDKNNHKSSVRSNPSIADMKQELTKLFNQRIKSKDKISGKITIIASNDIPLADIILTQNDVKNTGHNNYNNNNVPPIADKIKGKVGKKVADSTSLRKNKIIIISYSIVINDKKISSAEKVKIIRQVINNYFFDRSAVKTGNNK